MTTPRRNRKKKNRARPETADIRHESDSRPNIPSVEHASVMSDAEHKPKRWQSESEHPVLEETDGLDRDIDPQLVWRGKSPDRLEVLAPPLFVQERIRPKQLIDDLRRHAGALKNGGGADDEQVDMFGDFNGLPSPEARTEFYQHEAHWSNRLIAGDSLQVMASLSEREGLKGQVQCIYIDPPYGIEFNSNWQNRADQRSGQTMTHEPEQVKAFSDTWKDDIHSYLSYLRDRLLVARDLITESGSIFLQIGQDNVHRARCLMDEVFGEENFVSFITFTKTTALSSKLLPRRCDYIIWYAKAKGSVKYRGLFVDKAIGKDTGYTMVEDHQGTRRPMDASEKAEPNSIGKELTPISLSDLVSTGYTASCYYDFEFQGQIVSRRAKSWRTHPEGMSRLIRADRLHPRRSRPYYVQKHSDYPAQPLDHLWNDVGAAPNPNYVVETNPRVIERCILMTTDPGDLVLDPTCGGGTTAYVSEYWGRRWITIDTSRIALLLSRSRVMGAAYPYFTLADSADGAAELERNSHEWTTLAASPARVGNSAAGDEGFDRYSHDVRQGFLHERLSHITLGAIANNLEIDEIWERHRTEMESLRGQLNQSLGTSFEEWQMPREPHVSWSADAVRILHIWWSKRAKRQREIDASIASNTEHEIRCDVAHEDPGKARVAGPFTVESVLPHRALTVEEASALGDDPDGYACTRDTADVTAENYIANVLANLEVAGVTNRLKGDRIHLTNLEPNADGGLIAAEAEYGVGLDQIEAGKVAIFIAPQHDTVARPDLIDAATEAASAGIDTLISLAFAYDSQTVGASKIGKVTVIQAKMGAEMHMGEIEIGKDSDLFTTVGEPDVEVLYEDDGRIKVRVKGMDIYNPRGRDVQSSDAEDIAMWLLDTDYDAECFFVRHAYFLDSSDPYENLRTTLKGEINEDAWETLKSDTSRPFDKPSTGRVAVKVINRQGDEAMKVLRIA